MCTIQSHYLADFDRFLYLFICFIVCLFVCLFLCFFASKITAGLICMKFSGKVWSDHGTIWLQLWSIPRNRAIPRCATRWRPFWRGLLCIHTTACCWIKLNITELYIHHSTTVISECWTRQNGIHGFGGRPLLGITTADQCMLACVRNASCVAIDFDPSNLLGKYCWLLTNTLSNRAPGIIHYVLNRACACKTRL